MAGLEANFLRLDRGRRFSILHRAEPARSGSGAILFVAPFAEEMNKSRRMVALQAQALADAGWNVLRMDLFGCGDSDGEFGDASWQQWVSDVVDGSAWLRERSGQAPALWGLRSGCLLAVQAANALATAPDLLLWQPVVSGRQYLAQFLRMKVAANMLGSHEAPKLGTAELHDQLARGQSVEVAGYDLSPAIAQGLEQTDLAPPSLPASVAWLEVGNASGMTAAAHSRTEAWRAAGHRVDARVVSGPPFWQTQEIAECPALIDATLAAVAAWRT